MAEQKMSASEAVNEMIRMENMLRSAEHVREALQVYTGLEGKTAVIKKEIGELEIQKGTAEQELADLVKAVNQARSDSKAAMAAIQADVDAKRKSAAADIAEMDKEYEDARVRANEKLAAQLQAGRDEVDAWRKDLSDIQKKFHRLEADLAVLEQRKAQA